MIMTYSSALANYRNTVNQRFSNESTVKSNHRRIQTKYSLSDRGVRGVRGHQGCGRRNGRGGRGRVIVRIIFYWDVTGLNEHTIRLHPYYRFDNDQWFYIPE